MGIVLDRPSEGLVGEHVPQLIDAAGEDAPIYIGGPVQRSGLVVLAEFTDPSAAAWMITADVGFALCRPGDRRSRRRRDAERAFTRATPVGGGPARGREDGGGPWIVEAPIPRDSFRRAEDTLEQRRPPRERAARTAQARHAGGPVGQLRAQPITSWKSPRPSRRPRSRSRVVDEALPAVVRYLVVFVRVIGAGHGDELQRLGRREAPPPTTGPPSEHLAVVLFSCPAGLLTVSDLYSYTRSRSHPRAHPAWPSRQRERRCHPREPLPRLSSSTRA